MIRKIGEVWTRTKNGIEYTCTKIAEGNIETKRKSVYTHPNRAKGRSKDKANLSRKKYSDDVNWVKSLTRPDQIKATKPFDPNTQYMHRIDSRTLVIRNKAL